MHNNWWISLAKQILEVTDYTGWKWPCPMIEECICLIVQRASV